MNRRARAILWLDSAAAATAGVAVLVLRDWLTTLYVLPRDLVLFIAAANLAYGTYSGTLAMLASNDGTPRRRAIDVLVLANLAWVAVCAAILGSAWRSASFLGLAHVAFEALFVGSLAVAEFRYLRPLSR